MKQKIRPVPKRISIDTNQTLDSMLHQALNNALVACEAEAGSLMLVDNKRGILQIKARLGRPRHGRTKEPIYTIGDDSIAGWVAKNKRPYICSDVDNDPSFAASRSGKNFSSLLSVPIVHNGRTLAVINADSSEKKYFGSKHKARLQQVARQIAKPIADRISVSDALAQIGVELTRLPKEGGVDSVLSKIAGLALRTLGADVITLYQYNQEKDTFPVEGKGPTVAGEIRNPGPMRRKVYSGDVPWTVVKDRKPGFYSDVESQGFLSQNVNRPGEQRRSRFIAREGIKSMAALLLPFRAAEAKNEEVVGVMFASYRTPHQFNIDEISALASFADYASVAILNARHEEQHYTEQMQMFQTMAANFAHRMGNLVGVSRVACQTLRERIDPQDAVSIGQLDLIEQRANVLFELADRLTRPFKETEHMFELKPIDITKILEEELKRITPAFVNFDRNPARILPRVMSVEFQLRQVLHDLLSNALEAIKDQKTPQLEVRAIFNPKSNRMELEIIDNGTGIRDDIRERLFSPGVTTKKEQLGIGLWWSRTFMQATGGDVTLKHTQLGKGTTFLVEIPCVSGHQGDSPPARTLKETDILVVDDDPAWLRAFVDNLARDRYEIATAAGYSEASSLLATTHFKVAVLDVRLVDADPSNVGGLELLAKIGQAGLDTKVVMISAFGTEQHAEIAKRSPNLLAFLHKQKVDMRSIRDMLGQVIRPPTTTKDPQSLTGQKR